MSSMFGSPGFRCLTNSTTATICGDDPIHLLRGASSLEVEIDNLGSPAETRADCIKREVDRADIHLYVVAFVIFPTDI